MKYATCRIMVDSRTYAFGLNNEMQLLLQFLKCLMQPQLDDSGTTMCRMDKTKLNLHLE